MRSTWWIGLSAVATVIVTASSMPAQDAGAPPRQAAATPAASSSRSTRTGVYTRAQATRGRAVYAGMCQSCHSPASHTGVTFANWWNGHPASDLFGFISERMPKNDPGSLSGEQYADVVAYLFQMNGMPPGKTELPADSTALSAIRIDTTPRRAAGAPKK